MLPFTNASLIQPSPPFPPLLHVIASGMPRQPRRLPQPASRCSVALGWRRCGGVVVRRCRGSDLEGDFELEAEILEFMEGSEKPQAFPSRRDLVEAGRLDLVDAIVREGGWLSLGWDLGEEETQVSGFRSWNEGYESSGDELSVSDDACCSSSSGRSLEPSTTEVDTGIEGILNRLEKQRNLTLGFVLRDTEDSTGVESNDNKHDWSHETSIDAPKKTRERNDYFFFFNPSLCLLILVSFSLFSVTSASTLTTAATILADSGYNTFSVALDRASNSVSSPPPSLTVFAPSDTAFSGFGEPSLDLILFHISPVGFPLGTRIKTLRSGHSVAVTDVSVDNLVSLSNVPVTATPLFNDGSLIIYDIDRLFNTASSCSFTEAIEVLRSHRCSLMACFLEMESTSCGSALTVFAPVDQVLVNRFGDLSLFRCHVALGYLSWSDLASLEQGTVLMTKFQGFTIEVSRYDDVLVVNDATVLMPEIFRSDWLVVHAIGDVLDLSKLGPVPKSKPNGLRVH